ncbi:SNW domain-containing protein, putative [Perkinsus marinus ATCC 50983]|uniref:SNW domain-containing protein, putative n=1 Tax=Perkinsus marinus (strain ATCC 50983 / TXsc) TaxID=423536 RepID=C5L4Y7_PERM5|nr:SNW domain-containing protein, putative [Perkinsus marinus ATCC 50983]EER08207.1 SNW domain-containing protein, putative [Perkinsus marinus ATCC 50983]|eukprot:XP_002776391.1 SNW domain-containing protein, putative [Perkinsus marinus ATCC 50983]
MSIVRASDSSIKQALARHQHKPGDLKERWTPEASLDRPDALELRKNTDETRSALEAVLAQRIGQADTTREHLSGANDAQRKLANAQYLRYTPSKDAPGRNPNIKQRVIKVVEVQKDPMEPPKFRHHKVPAPPSEPPPPVLRSPPKKLTKEDQAMWKIPPCVSNWKNAKGYVIPLDKRIAADGRGLQDVTVSERHAQFAEDLYIAETKARQEIRIRNELAKQKATREQESEEQKLRDLAAKARRSRTNAFAGGRGDREEAEDYRRQDEARAEVMRETLREHRMEKAGRNKQGRDRDEERDISELIALGKQVQPSSKGEGQYDARLFNQSGGLDSGFYDDGANNVYDKRLFADRSSANKIYQYDAKRLEQAREEYDRAEEKAGGESNSAAAVYQRQAPVQFETAGDQDQFGLSGLLDDDDEPQQKQASKRSRGGREKEEEEVMEDCCWLDDNRGDERKSRRRS